MSKSPLVDRMRKKNAPKTWIVEVERMQEEKSDLEDKVEEYLGIIDCLARQLEREEEEFEEYERIVSG